MLLEDYGPALRIGPWTPPIWLGAYPTVTPPISLGTGPGRGLGSCRATNTCTSVLQTQPLESSPPDGEKGS